MDADMEDMDEVANTTVETDDMEADESFDASSDM